MKARVPNPRKRKPRGQFTRLYRGGIMDGRTDIVPIFTKEPPLRTIVNKPLWDGATLIAENPYQLAEPAQKPKNGATYIYIAA